MTAIAMNAITPTTIHTVDVEPSSVSASLVLVSSPSVVSPVTVDAGRSGRRPSGGRCRRRGGCSRGGSDRGAEQQTWERRRSWGRRRRVVDVDHGGDLFAARCVERHVVDRGRGLRSRRQDQQPWRGKFGGRITADPCQFLAVRTGLHGRERQQFTDRVGSDELDRERASLVRRQAAARPLDDRATLIVLRGRHAPSVDVFGLRARYRNTHRDGDRR